MDRGLGVLGDFRNVLALFVRIDKSTIKFLHFYLKLWLRLFFYCKFIGFFLTCFSVCKDKNSQTGA